VLALLLLAAAACVSQSPDSGTIALHNRACGLMGRNDFAAALAIFAELHQRFPDDAEIAVNLAIATLNNQKPGDEERAAALLDAVLARTPDHSRARYCAALLALRRGEAEPALAGFEAVLRADPSDADAAFSAGQALMELGRHADALAMFARALAADPYLRSAHYRAFQALQRLGRTEAAGTHLQTFSALAGNPRARVVELKYTRMGRRAEVATIDAAPARRPTERPRGALFEPPRPIATELPWRGAGDEFAGSTSMTACDVNGDGRLDLFLTSALVGPARNALLLGGAEPASFAPALDHPLAGVAGVNAALWGDVDNDGSVDVYLCRRGDSQLWRQEPTNSWQDITVTAGARGTANNTADGVLFDADHDGDLDILLINPDAPPELLNNNRDGTFRLLTAELGGVLGQSWVRSATVADLDQDRAADLVLVGVQPPNQLVRNQLGWAYQPVPGTASLCAAELIAVVAADADADGRSELYTLDHAGALARWHDDGGEWRATTLSADAEPAAADTLAIADVDGDGSLDAVLCHSTGFRVVALSTGAELARWHEGGAPFSAWALVTLDPRRGPALVGWRVGGPPMLWSPGPGRFEFLAVTASGREDEANAVRSNASGIGTRLALRTGSRWTVVGGVRRDSGPGQSLQPIAFGLGGAERADFLALDWSDGVYQTELELGAGGLHRIVETQRQLSSCPVLFAWDGARFAFVSDLLGVGGIGYATGPHEYAPERPREALLLPPGLPNPDNGQLTVRLDEPMEEVTYLDRVSLVGYDLPPGWSVTLDERMATGGPEPTGAPVFYRRMIGPEGAVNERGEDVTAAILTRDQRAAPVGPIDPRFIGRLAGEHVLTLELGAAVEQDRSTAWLLADGWVEYPYSQTNFAAWQAAADYHPPTLEARGTDGVWRTVLPSFGYPAGMPRQMTVPLPPLPPGTRALRLRTNQEIYWDRLALIFAEACPEAIRHEAVLIAAELDQPGFARRSDHPQRRPEYNHERCAPLWDTRVQAGFYSRFGDVTELLATLDDAVAIFGAGEGVRLAFATPPSAPPPGWTRTWVLDARGWCKDMDLYTRDGATVEPLPAAGHDRARRDALHREYNTRYQWGQ
jgi:Tfp pilus assembly protein PilF